MAGGSKLQQQRRIDSGESKAGRSLFLFFVAAIVMLSLLCQSAVATRYALGRIRYVEVWVGSTTSGSNNAMGTAASLYRPFIPCINTATGALLIADYGNQLIRQAALDGNVITLTGQQGNGGYANGTGTNATHNQPKCVTMDATNTYFYVSERLNHIVRIVTVANLFVGTLAGTPGLAGRTDGTGNHSDALTQTHSL